MFYGTVFGLQLFATHICYPVIVLLVHKSLAIVLRFFSAGSCVYSSSIAIEFRAAGACVYGRSHFHG